MLSPRFLFHGENLLRILPINLSGAYEVVSLLEILRKVVKIKMVRIKWLLQNKTARLGFAWSNCKEIQIGFDADSQNLAVSVSGIV